MSRCSASGLWPSGLKATAKTAFSCCKGDARGLPVTASQRRAVPSSDPVARVRPFGLKATEIAAFSCCRRGARGLPVTTSQRRVVAPRLPRQADPRRPRLGGGDRSPASRLGFLRRPPLRGLDPQRHGAPGGEDRPRAPAGRETGHLPRPTEFPGDVALRPGLALDRIQYALWHPGDPEAKLFALLHTAITGGASLPVAPSSEDPAVLSIGPFGDHLRRHLWALLKNDRLRAVVAGLRGARAATTKGSSSVSWPRAWSPARATPRRARVARSIRRPSRSAFEGA